MTRNQPAAVAGRKTESVDGETLRREFDTAYNAWFRSNYIAPDLRAVVESYDVTAEEFEKLTRNQQFQRYISLIEGKIRLDELPGPPHGALIGKVVKILGHQLDGSNGIEITLHGQ